MKKAILVLFLNTIPAFAFAQAAMQLDKMKTLYVCNSNSLCISAEGYDPASLMVTTNNGEIPNYYAEKVMHVTIWPAKTGSCTIYVKVKMPGGKLKTIDSGIYLVRRVHYGRAMLDGGTEKISRAWLRIQIGLAGPVMRDVTCDHYSTNSFVVNVYRNRRLIFKKKNSSHGSFDSETRDFFNGKINAGDVILFTDVTMIDCDHSVVDLEPTEVTVTE